MQRVAGGEGVDLKAEQAQDQYTRGPIHQPEITINSYTQNVNDLSQWGLNLSWTDHTATDPTDDNDKLMILVFAPEKGDWKVIDTETVRSQQTLSFTLNTFIKAYNLIIPYFLKSNTAQTSNAKPLATIENNTLTVV